MESGAWSLEAEVWSVESGVWSLGAAAWTLESAIWSLESEGSFSLTAKTDGFRKLPIYKLILRNVLEGRIHSPNSACTEGFWRCW